VLGKGLLFPIKNRSSKGNSSKAFGSWPKILILRIGVGFDLSLVEANFSPAKNFKIGGVPGRFGPVTGFFYPGPFNFFFGKKSRFTNRGGIIPGKTGFPL